MDQGGRSEGRGAVRVGEADGERMRSGCRRQRGRPMSTAGDAKRSRGRLRARGEAKAGTGRPSARPEPDSRSQGQARWTKEGVPKGAARCELERPTASGCGAAVEGNEADR